MVFECFTRYKDKNHLKENYRENTYFCGMNKGKKTAETPMMKQYAEVKATYPEAILLFRVGDFYETFGEDAVTASRVLGIVLTRRASGSGSYTELAGFPHHSLESYLPRLVRAGYKVVVCDQLEDPKLTKKIVKRGVTEVVTPGLVYNEQILSQKENNYLASLAFWKDRAGVALLDISTGTFRVAEGLLADMEALLSTFKPKEVLLPKGYEAGFRERFALEKIYVSTMDEWAFVHESAREKLCRQLGVDQLKGFGVDRMELAITAAGAALFYLESSQQKDLGHICALTRIDRDEYVWMDRFSVRNLELFEASAPDGVCLLQVIDKTLSPMGGRLLRHWLALPIRDLRELNARYDAVDLLLSDPDRMEELQDRITRIGDLERLAGRIASGRVVPRGILQLKRAWDEMDALTAWTEPAWQSLLQGIGGGGHWSTEIGRILCEEPAGQIGKGAVIAAGVDPTLDELRDIVQNGKRILLDIQQRETERTGISSLKISYNNVFGYYLEVRNTHKDKVPADWIRKQTLVNAERYITQELKEYEERILGAEEKILALEQRIFNELLAAIQQQVPLILEQARRVARLDVLLSFAQCAKEYGYARPEMNDGDALQIVQGRHPVIERMMREGEAYVPNDLSLDRHRQQIIILTGPNMAGKSALLRQTALVVLMAQIGSFVPAQRAVIGYVDKIFTRVGASDNLSRGESTFMSEMLESATILHNLSERSLVLLDEIGRGTSTYDGMSIAWGIVEYLHEHGERAKTLFATHYHELNDLEKRYERVHNYHIAVRESGSKIVFLRKLCPGGVAHSFGIHVARLAGMPAAVVHSAEAVLRQLESTSSSAERPVLDRIKPQEPMQLSFFQLDDPLLESIRDTLRDMDLNSMSPLDAFDLLRELRKRIGVK